MNENCNSELAKQSETQSLLFSTFFLSQAKTAKHNNHRLRKKDISQQQKKNHKIHNNVIINQPIFILPAL